MNRITKISKSTFTCHNITFRFSSNNPSISTPKKLIDSFEIPKYNDVLIKPELNKKNVGEKPPVNEKVEYLNHANGKGGRKTSKAVVYIREGTGLFQVNGKPYIDYFTNYTHREAITSPLAITGMLDSMDVKATVKGGGTSGQAGAVRLAVANAIQKYRPSFRPVMKKAHMLTRDARIVERKKPGRYKARKSYPYQRR